MEYPKPLERLIGRLAALPGVGRKTAQRLAFHIMSMDEYDVEQLVEAISEGKKNLHFCSRCGNLTDVDPCNICTSDERDHKVICVVETPQDLMAMERMKEFHGLYHVLHGVISPLEGTTISDLNMMSLVKRMSEEPIEEVIVATNPTVEGEATAMYIASLLKPAGIKVSRIAHGLPVGGDLEYADEVTLLKALEGRRNI